MPIISPCLPHKEKIISNWSIFMFYEMFLWKFPQMTKVTEFMFKDIGNYKSPIGICTTSNPTMVGCVKRLAG